MKRVLSIKQVGRKKVADLTVADVQHYILENGIVSHNTGSYYSSNDIWILGRQQEKDEDGIAGYHFIINVEKSRYVKERSKIPISVMYDGFINKYSGLFDIALESGHIKEVSKGWYTIDGTDLKQRKSQLMENTEIWDNLIKDESFQDYIKTTYSLE